MIPLGLPTEESDERLITVGEIVRPHGIKGELRVLPTTDFPERFTEGLKVLAVQETARNESQPLTVEKARPHKQYLLVSFLEVEDRNEAEMLRGALLQVPESELVPLEAGEFYCFQLFELEVYSEDGELLGTVSEILTTGSNDVLVLEPSDSSRRRPIMVPMTREVVNDVDLDRGELHITVLPGLLEV